jgi:hypothetical protein
MAQCASLLRPTRWFSLSLQQATRANNDVVIRANAMALSVIARERRGLCRSPAVIPDAANSGDPESISPVFPQQIPTGVMDSGPARNRASRNDGGTSANPRESDRTLKAGIPQSVWKFRIADLQRRSDFSSAFKALAPRTCASARAKRK